jgi:RHS repeat-associated protein
VAFFPTDRRFTGQQWEASLGLYDYRARFYDPTLGRFLQPDPIVPEPGNPQALNRYAYVYNNPLRYTDPSGHCPWCIAVGVALIVLKVVDYGWTAYDAWQSLRVMNDPNASPEARAEAAANLALTAAFEAGEPDDWLPVSLPLDDLGRVGLIGGVKKVGKEVGEEVVERLGKEAENEAAKKLPPVVIGENMKDRVIPYAKRIGAETIDDWLAGRAWTPQLNDEFIAAIKAEGREIIDIGPDFERRLRYRLDPSDPRGRPPSIIYSRERQQLRGYPKHHRVYQRFGKYWGGVAGLDY